MSGAGLLMPDIKTDRPDRAVCVGGQEMAARMEVTMDEGVSRKEGLRWSPKALQVAKRESRP
jgi:hypothetical protein